MKIKYIKWFIQCIGRCVRDIGNFRENWRDFQTQISLDKNPEIKRLLKEIEEFHYKKQIAGRGENDEFIYEH